MRKSDFVYAVLNNKSAFVLLMFAACSVSVDTTI